MSLIWGRFGISFGSILGRFGSVWGSFGVDLRQLCGRLGVDLRAAWDGFGVQFGAKTFDWGKMWNLGYILRRRIAGKANSVRAAGAWHAGGGGGAWRPCRPLRAQDAHPCRLRAPGGAAGGEAAQAQPRPSPGPAQAPAQAQPRPQPRPQPKPQPRPSPGPAQASAQAQPRPQPRPLCGRTRPCIALLVWEVHNHAGLVCATSPRVGSVCLLMHRVSPPSWRPLLRARSGMLMTHEAYWKTRRARAEGRKRTDVCVYVYVCAYSCMHVCTYSYNWFTAISTYWNFNFFTRLARFSGCFSASFCNSCVFRQRFCNL